jgi:hypothetical protein
VKREPQELIPDAAVYDDVLKGAGFAFACQQGPVNRHVSREAPELPPQVRATV